MLMVIRARQPRFDVGPDGLLDRPCLHPPAPPSTPAIPSVPSARRRLLLSVTCARRRFSYRPRGCARIKLSPLRFLFRNEFAAVKDVKCDVLNCARYTRIMVAIWEALRGDEDFTLGPFLGVDDQ